jgi:hypothetical protein
MEPSVSPFLSAMFGVLVALGIARLIAALASFTTAREPIRIYWVHGAWILFMLLLFLTAVVVLAVTRNEKTHAALTLASGALFLTWVVSFGLQHG